VGTSVRSDRSHIAGWRSGSRAQRSPCSFQGRARRVHCTSSTRRSSVLGDGLDRDLCRVRDRGAGRGPAGRRALRRARPPAGDPVGPGTADLVYLVSYVAFSVPASWAASTARLPAASTSRAAPRKRDPLGRQLKMAVRPVEQRHAQRRLEPPDAFPEAPIRDGTRLPGCDWTALLPLQWAKGAARRCPSPRPELRLGRNSGSYCTSARPD
jgi:hypothetical protein